jgi:hypothetical protein
LNRYRRFFTFYKRAHFRLLQEKIIARNCL